MANKMTYVNFATCGVMQVNNSLSIMMLQVPGKLVDLTFLPLPPFGGCATLGCHPHPLNVPVRVQDLDEMAKLERGARSGSVGSVAAYCGPCCRRKCLLGYLGETRGGCGEGEEACDFCKVRLMPMPFACVPSNAHFDGGRQLAVGLS